jgi:alpha-tubulin suppressor-like RCC1 family protein
LHNVLAIAAGGQTSVALKADGTVVAWGLDNYGQATVPVGLNNVTAISAGHQFCLALTSKSP